jgi:hypothetical protein
MSTGKVEMLDGILGIENPHDRHAYPQPSIYGLKLGPKTPILKTPLIPLNPYNDCRKRGVLTNKTKKLEGDIWK